jgi:hypothetical protein
MTFSDGVHYIKSGIAGVRVGSGFQPAAGLLSGVSPRHEERRLKAGGRLKAWPHIGAPCLAYTYAPI